MSNSWQGSIRSQHESARNEGLWRTRRVLSGAQGVDVQVDASRLVNFSSNDYLGFANHSVIKKSAADACRQFGSGSGSSHLVCGHLELHQQLELELASFVGSERAVLFSNGYMANLSVCSAFLAKGDLLLQDKLNHASLIDGAKLSAASFKRYRHGGLDHAEKLAAVSEFKRCMIASDGVFSMDGDIAPLKALSSLATIHQALLLIDDAHGFGVLGENGRGTLETANMSPADNILMMGTFGKALGCYGAFVAGDDVYIEHLIQTARPYMYTTALPPSVVASALAALRILVNEGDKYRNRLFENIKYFQRSAAALGLPILPSETAIKPMLIGDPCEAVRLSENLFRDGFNVVAIRPPTVPKGSARLRIALSAAHSHRQIEQLLCSIKRHFNGGNYG